MPLLVPSPALSARLVGSPRERRAKVRYACRLKGSGRTLGQQGPAWQAVILDASQTGLRLLMDRPHKPRTLLSLQLDNGPRRFRRGLYLRVVHSQAAEDGLWSVGCSFVTPLEAEELLELIACSSSQATGLTAELKAAAQKRAAQADSGQASSRSPLPPPVTPSSVSPPELVEASVVAASEEQEKRRSPRRGASLTVVQISRPGSWSRPVEGWVVNKSLGGMCLCSPRKFDVHTLLEVRPKRSSDPKSKVELQVLQAREQGGRYMLHCQFVSHPPMDVFQLL